MKIDNITAARIERTEGSVVIHVSEHGHVDGWDHRIEVPLEGITSFGYIDDLVRVVIVVDSLSHELRHELRFRNRYLASSVLDAIGRAWATRRPVVTAPEAEAGAKVLYPEGTAFSPDDPAARPTHGRIMSNGVLRLGTPGNPEGGAWRRIDWDYIENQRWDALDAANALISGETITYQGRPCRLQYLDEDQPDDVEAEAVHLDTDGVLTDEMLALFSSQLENAKPDSLWVMSAPRVAALVETTIRHRRTAGQAGYVRAEPAIDGEIDDDQLVRWLEQFDRVPSDTLCSITRADLVHLLETARRYKKVADILNTLRTTL